MATIAPKAPPRPKRKKIDPKKIHWLLDELYRDREDPKLDKDFKALERGCKRFAKDYHGRVGKLDAVELKKALTALERIETIAYRLFIYTGLEFATKSNDPAWGAFQQSVQERYTQASSHLEFFRVEWNRLAESKAKKLIADKRLARYRHFLEHSRLFKRHTLSEPEEILASKLGQVGPLSWKRYYNTVLSDVAYSFRGKSITGAELTAKLQDPNRDVRRDASEARSKALLTSEKPLTFAFNMMLAGAMIGDDVRKHGHWVQRRNLSNEIPDKVVDALVEVMASRSDILQRYMRLKAKIMGLRPLMSYDVWAPLPGSRQPRADYAKAMADVQELFADTRPSFGRIAGEMFAKNHVDVPPYKGKRGGAFCMSNMEGLPYVLLNWTGKLRDVATLAHEFGHAVHMELSRKRGPLGGVESLVMAEVASVFMETLLYQRLLSNTRSARQRLDLLRQIIEDGFATTFRQMQFNRFENTVHNHRREKGELSAKEIGAHYREAEAAFFSKTIKPQKDSECFWMYVTHFVNVPGYVYAYCASYLVVLALYKRFQEEGESFLVGYEKMLAAGGSQSPEELLAGLGVDWGDPAFWHGGLDVMATYVDMFEKTAKELKLV